jgi:hypothetical protein
MTLLGRGDAMRLAGRAATKAAWEVMATTWSTSQATQAHQSPVKETAPRQHNWVTKMINVARIRSGHKNSARTVDPIEMPIRNAYPTAHAPSARQTRTPFPHNIARVVIHLLRSPPP